MQDGLKYVKPHNLTNKGFRLALQTQNFYKKLCTFTATKRDSSLYIHFTVRETKCVYGIGKMSTDGRGKIDLDNGKRAMLLPKISYHETGLVRLKIGEDKKSIESIQSTPLTEIRDKQIATFRFHDLLGLEDFNEGKYGKDNHLTLETDEDLDTIGYKINLYASTSSLKDKRTFSFSVMTGVGVVVYFGLELYKSEDDNRGEFPGFFSVICGDFSRKDKFLYMHSIK